MRSAIQVSALLLALGGGLGLLTAQHNEAAIGQASMSRTPYAAIVDDYDNEITGSIGRGSVSQLTSESRLTLNDEQRGFIFLGVINLPGIPDTFLHMPEPGTPLPEAVELHDIPPMVARRIPEVAGYKFAKLDDRILVVKAETRQVADMIPRYRLVFH
jgi:hypothetical protein